MNANPVMEARRVTGMGGGGGGDEERARAITAVWPDSVSGDPPTCTICTAAAEATEPTSACSSSPIGGIGLSAGELLSALSSPSFTALSARDRGAATTAGPTTGADAAVPAGETDAAAEASAPALPCSLELRCGISISDSGDRTTEEDCSVAPPLPPPDRIEENCRLTPGLDCCDAVFDSDDPPELGLPVAHSTPALRIGINMIAIVTVRNMQEYIEHTHQRQASLALLSTKRQ